MNEQQAGRRLEVVAIESGRIVHAIALGGLSERQLERVMTGLLAHLDLARYCVREVPS